MLEMTQGQMDILLDHQRQRFIADALPVLRQEFPELWVRHSESELTHWLHDECVLAQRYRLMTAEGVYLFCSMRLRLGSTFPAGDEFVWAREICERQFVTEAERLDALEAVLWGA